MAKGYSLDALVDEHYIRSGNVLETRNIDNMWGRASIGTFPQNQNVFATVENGYPAGAQAGNLEVLLTDAGNIDNSVQRYTNFADMRMWIRTQSGSSGNRTWGPWMELINANNIYNAIYPIGIVLKFDNATNPNNAFTGTVWEQITDGRVARAATGPVAGTTAGQIGSVAGSDTSTIAVTNLPGHTHGMQNHTHEVPKHSHTMDHNHSINHGHGEAETNTAGGHVHALNGTTSIDGSHSHGVTVREADGTGAAIADSDGGGVARTAYTDGAGNHYHIIGGTALAAGDHAHVAYVRNFVGTSGGPSVGWVGDTALNTYGPSNNTTTSTGDGTALNVRNSSHYYAFWKRVA